MHRLFLSLTLAAAMLSIGDLRAQDAFAAVFRAAGDGRTLVTAPTWTAFNTAYATAATRGLRLVDLSVNNDAGDRKFVGVFQSGTDAHFLGLYHDWAVLAAAAAQNTTRRLVDIEAWTQGSTLYLAGVWRAGSGDQVLHKADSWPAFTAQWEQLSAKGMRITRVASWLDQGTRRYGALYRPGNGAHYLWAGDWASFSTKAAENHKLGLTLVDLETYEDGARQYLGIWAPDNGGNYLWIGNDYENLRAKSYELGKINIQLVDLESFAGCNECANQVTRADPYYTYGFIGASAGWPAIVDGTEFYARLSALEFSEQPFYLPFSDRDVRMGGGWLYSPGSWHLAYDYAQPDRGTFEVRAAAAGHVISTGWDWWSGNYVVVGHDVGGVTNRFITMYLHLRNGPSNDCTQSWVTQQDMANLGNVVPATTDSANWAASAANYKAYLEDTGCTNAIATRNLEADYWGTDAQAIPANLTGQQVAAGALIGWAGQTGPGGQGGVGPANTHLHIFWSRLDSSDNKHYFIDPHGTYGPGGTCYPATITDAMGGACRRYAIAWRDGRPQYPPGY